MKYAPQLYITLLFVLASIGLSYSDSSTPAQNYVQAQEVTLAYSLPDQ